MATTEERERVLISFMEQINGNAAIRANICPACADIQRVTGALLRGVRRMGGDVRQGKWDEEEVKDE